MRQFLIIILLFLTSSSLWATKLSKDAKISVLTCSPGDEVYSLYGHTAIRVEDPQNRLNIVYNYGTFDVNDPDFYVNFCKGWLRYYLSVEDFHSFCAYYVTTNQQVSEQVLQLSETQKQKLYVFLEENRKPENKYYNYDFFLDNCATRVYDIIYKVCDSSIVLQKKQGDTRFRAAINQYQQESFPWLSLAINLVLTHLADDVMTVHQETFLPERLQTHLATAQLDNKPLIATANLLVEKKPVNKEQSFFTPTVLFLILFLLFSALSALEIVRKKHFLILSRIFAVAYVFFGIFIIVLWSYSDLVVVNYNLNLLWLLPAAILFFSFKKRLVQGIGFVLIAIMALQLILNQLLPQSIPVEAMLLSALMQMRIFVAWYFGRRASGR